MSGGAGKLWMCNKLRRCSKVWRWWQDLETAASSGDGKKLQRYILDDITVSLGRSEDMGVGQGGELRVESVVVIRVVVSRIPCLYTQRLSSCQLCLKEELVHGAGKRIRC